MQAADLSKLQVRAYFDEPEIGDLQLNDPVSIVWDAKPDMKFHGHITRLPSTIITYGTRFVGEVLVSVEDSNGVLLPNTNVVVTVITQEVRHALTVPREALHIEGGRDYVYVVSGDTLHRAAVQVGAINLTMVQILSGLTGWYGCRPGHHQWRADLRGCSHSHCQLRISVRCACQFVLLGIVSLLGQTGAHAQVSFYTV